MRRKLWVALQLVKGTLPGLFLAIAGCGGGQVKPPEDDPYGAAIAECVDAPRGVSDAANDHMIALRPGLAVVGSATVERRQAQRDYGRGGDQLFNDEEPSRQVKVHGFRMDRSPVTAAAYAEIVPACGVIPPDAESITAQVWQKLSRSFGLRADYATVTHFIWDGDRPAATRGEHPMVLVTHRQAAFYCAWRGARLPSALEWERAARGQVGNIYPWGAQFDPSRVHVGQDDSAEVGSVSGGNTAEGFTDMGGLVLEWTGTQAPGHKRIVKGNAWNGLPGYGRGASKRVLPEAQQDITLGFRCAL